MRKKVKVQHWKKYLGLDEGMKIAARWERGDTFEATTGSHSEHGTGTRIEGAQLLVCSPDIPLITGDRVEMESVSYTVRQVMYFMNSNQAILEPEEGQSHEC